MQLNLLLIYIAEFIIALFIKLMKNLLLILFSSLSFGVLSQNIVKQKLFESKFIGWEIERAILMIKIL
jgi:hypothetical protein